MALVTTALTPAATAATVTVQASLPPQPIGPGCFGAPADRFDDVAGSHAYAIDCIGWWGVTQGVGDHRYDPGGVITRGQMASFLARLLASTGATLPANPPAAFGDAAGSRHELAINQLAELGVVRGVTATEYRPAATVTRGQMATFLAGVWQVRVGTPLPDGSSVFADVVGNRHETNIDRVAAAGFTGGVTATRFEPGAPVTRAQMGSFLARLLAKLVAEQHAAYPPPDAVPLPVRQVVEGMRLGTDCAAPGLRGRSPAGAPLVCRDLFPGSEPLWHRRMDDVAIRAYAELGAWVATAPPASAPIPIHRHGSVPTSHEDAVRQLFDHAGGLFEDYDDDFVALLVPWDARGHEFAYRHIVESLPASTTPEERDGVIAALGDLFVAECGGFSRQGRTQSRSTQFLIGVYPVTASHQCGSALTPNTVVTGISNEWLGARMRLMNAPCWAGEGKNQVLGRAVMAHLGIRPIHYGWEHALTQLSRAPVVPSMLGLDRSHEDGHHPERGQYCSTGVGHTQGALAHELLIDRYGIEAWLAWGELSESTGGYRPEFQTTYGISIEAFIRDVDARTYRLLELPG